MGKLFTFDKTISAGGKKYLSDIIPEPLYKEWFKKSSAPKIYILNKGICGNGGTTGFIRYCKSHNHGMYCLVPNVSIVRSKEVDQDICCVYGGEDGDPGKPVKVCTWDKGMYVMDKYPEWGFGDDIFSEAWVNSCLVVDEYQKLVDDSEFREICVKMLSLVMRTDLNVVLMSATPNYEIIDYLRAYSGKEVITIDIDYGYGDEMSLPEKQIYYIDNLKKYGRSNSVRNIIEAVISAHPEFGHICFFLNSVKECHDIVFDSTRKNDMEVLCSKSRADKDVCNYSDKFNQEKKYHFLTSAYFTGHDITVYTDLVVVIGGNSSKIKSYTATDIKQIEGRFREGYGKLYVIKSNNGIMSDDMGVLKADMEDNMFWWDNINDPETRRDPRMIEKYLKMTQQKAQYNAMLGWEDFHSFRDMMSVYQEYKVVKEGIGDAGAAEKRKSMSFAEYKRRRVSGETDLDYKYAKTCEEYISLKGLEAFRNAGRNDIVMYVKLHRMCDGVDLDSMSADRIFDVFFKNGIYSMNYIGGAVEYLGGDAGNIQIAMHRMFGCSCVRYDKYRFLIVKN